MKKFLSILLLLAVVLSCCACAHKEPGQTEAAAPDPMSAEAMYGHIDQNVPMDGVYKIWNAEGVKAMASHPEGSFEILCDIDMEGAVLEPIGSASEPFTGTLNGTNFTISNFSIVGSKDGCLGFVGVGKGSIQDLRLANVTVTADSDARYIGTLAGRLEGKIQRCYVTGTLTVEAAAADAVCGGLAGAVSGDIKNTETTVDIRYTASGTASVAGIAGAAENGTLEYADTYGKLSVTGQNKTVALFAGSANNVTANNLAFIGAENSCDGKLITNYFGTEENVTWQTMLVRDNTRAPEQPHIQEKREKVAQYMYDMATTMWRVREPMIHNCPCQLSICHGTFSPEYTYFGPPYNHKASSLSRMRYSIDEEGYLKEFVTTAGEYDGYDMYIGTDCSGATFLAFRTVSPTVGFTQTQDEVPVFGKGTYPVGDYVYDLGLDLTVNAQNTKKYTDYNGAEVMYDAYAQARVGDAVVHWYDGAGHSRVCASDAVVVRDENGKINGQYSYILMHEQGSAVRDEINYTYSTWKTNWKYTFENLYGHYYIPLTIEEFITGEFPEVECTLDGGVSDSRLGLTTGVIKSNYALDYVTVRITDSTGRTVFDHSVFAGVSRAVVDGGYHTQTRNPHKEFDLVSFAPALQEVELVKGAAYHATVTATLMTGDQLVVNDFSFTNG